MIGEPTGDVPLSLRVTDPVEWLRTHDLNPELHRTVRHNIAAGRAAEAVLCLEWHIGRTALVRIQVDGWEEIPWGLAVTNLVRNRTPLECRKILKLLKELKSTPRLKGTKDA